MVWLRAEMACFVGLLLLFGLSSPAALAQSLSGRHCVTLILVESGGRVDCVSALES